jgi:hypothetical protein
MGDIAQLVERRLCKADVSGSSPLISTKSKNDSFFKRTMKENSFTDFFLLAPKKAKKLMVKGHTDYGGYLGT